MNGLDGISPELVSATRVALERQLHEAEDSLCLKQCAIENARRQEAWAFLQRFRNCNAGLGFFLTISSANDAACIDRLDEEASLDVEQLMEELAAARTKAYWCRRAITELNRAVATLATITSRQ